MVFIDRLYKYGMKLILILMLTIILSAETKHEILIPGFSYHTEKTVEGHEINEKNFGLGYRYSKISQKYESYIGAMVFNDSYSHPMYTVTGGYNLYIYKMKDFSTKIGIEGGLGVRKLLYLPEDEFRYSIIPIITPTFGVSVKNFGISISYIPSITIGQIKIHEVAYCYLLIEI